MNEEEAVSDLLAEDEEAGDGTTGAASWMVTFADLMALLLTLFVLLLTFSEMNVLKYKEIAGALKNAFGFAPQDRLASVIELEGSVILEALTPPKPDTPKVVTALPLPPDSPQVTELKIKRDISRQETAAETQKALEEKLQNTPGGEEIELERDEEEVLMRFPSKIAFASGSADISRAFAAILTEIAPIIRETPGSIKVSGHTDNLPLLSSRRFRSNWDLSAARAGSVVRWLVDNASVSATRLTLQGFGESRPIAPNDSRDGRTKNRRVEIAIRVEGRVDTADTPGVPAANPPAEASSRQ